MPEPTVLQRVSDGPSLNRILQNISDLLIQALVVAKHVVERLILPNSASAAKSLVNAVGGLALDRLHNLGNRKRVRRCPPTQCTPDARD